MIKTENLTKKYGELYAIKGIEMNLEKGDLFGFIGPNGAGKTTTMRIIATLSEPSWGCLLYTSPSPRDLSTSRMPSSA